MKEGEELSFDRVTDAFFKLLKWQWLNLLTLRTRHYDSTRTLRPAMSCYTLICSVRMCYVNWCFELLDRTTLVCGMWCHDVIWHVLTYWISLSYGMRWYVVYDYVSWYGVYDAMRRAMLSFVLFVFRIIALARGFSNSIPSKNSWHPCLPGYLYPPISDMFSWSV